MTALNSNSSEPRFNIASVKMCTEALGPYRRMSIWFQGCDLGCPGCCNPELQPFEVRHVLTQSELIRIATRARDEFGIEGVTFIGGEPTLQKGLESLASALRGLGLGIIMFTGKLFSELDGELIKQLDTVIDGRFETDNRDVSRNLIGSNNQRIINVTDRYSETTWFTDLRPDYIEIDIDDDEIISSGSTY